MSRQGKLKSFGEVRVLDYPTLKYTRNQKAEVTVKVCCSETYQPDQTRQPEERTDWLFIRVYGKSAENLHATVTKGMRLSIEGRLRIERWEDHNGHNTMPIIVISEWNYLDNKATNQHYIEKHGLARAPVQNMAAQQVPQQQQSGYAQSPQQAQRQQQAPQQQPAGQFSAPAYPVK